MVTDTLDNFGLGELFAFIPDNCQWLLRNVKHPDFGPTKSTLYFCHIYSANTRWGNDGDITIGYSIKIYDPSPENAFRRAIRLYLARNPS